MLKAWQQYFVSTAEFGYVCETEEAWGLWVCGSGQTQMNITG